MKKKGQVAIFIIIGILIVVSILVFFIWAKPTYFSDNVGIVGFEGCVRDSVEAGIIELSNNGGMIDNEFYHMYNGEKFAYLCYTGEYYKTCTVQVPILTSAFNENLEMLIKDEVEACYDASVDSLKAQGYDVRGGEVTYEVEIEPGVVSVNIDAPTSTGAVKFSKFNVNVDSPIYEMLMITTSIMQFESTYGDTLTNEIMDYYPQYYVEKVKRGEGTSVYILRHKELGNEFKFASRSLVFPAGYY